MEVASSLSIWSSMGLFAALYLFFLARNKRKNCVAYRPQPPGPQGWPVVGNMFDLGSVPHQTLAGLREKYGPVVSLKLGAVNTIVVLSVEATAELFKNHDLSFADRSINEAMRSCSYNEGSLALAQYGPYWRFLRRICTTELFVNKRLKETAAIRMKCADDMVKWIAEAAAKKGGVEVRRFAFLAVFNLIGNLMLSRDLLDPQSKEGAEFFYLSSQVTVCGGQPNVADFFPFLRWLDPQGIRRNMDRDLGRAMDIAGGFIEEHIQNQSMSNDSRKKDFLDVLLEFRGQEQQEPEEISHRDLKIMILELFIAATDTTSSTIEWAMTELLRNPQLMRKVQAELRQVIGQGVKIQEKHMEDLKYLHALIKETLRLHPPLPFLIPRRAVKDTKYMGYSIAKDTQVFVHTWAIGRDPASWDDPLSFKPERFLNSDIDYQGHHFQLIPFGAGRRMCVGILLADRMLQLLLGSLLHCFDWVLDGNVTPDTIDMGEQLGMILRKAIPLKAIPKPRIA